MEPQYLTVNTDELLPIERVKRLYCVTDDDRASLAKLGEHVDPDRFNVKIETVGSKVFASETLVDLMAQGVSFVKVDNRAYVPAINIVKARNLTQEDRELFEERTGRKLRDDLIATLQTKAGKILSSVSAEKIMDRIANPPSFDDLEPVGPS